MTVAFELFVLMVGIATFYYLVRNGYASADALMAWIGATLAVVGPVLFFIAYIAEHSINDELRQVATFAVIVCVLVASVIGALQLAKRQREQPAFDDRTQTTPPTPKQNQYVHAYGTYTRADVQAERAKAQRIRRGAKA